MKKVFRCVYTLNSINLKMGKSPYLKTKLLVHIVVDYAYTQFLNFFLKTKKFAKPKVESVKKRKKWAKI